VPDLQGELPESIRGMIQRKVDQLGEADRQLLLAASVQGPEFDSAVVAQGLGRETAAVEERLDVLERVHAPGRPLRQPEFPGLTLALGYGFIHVPHQNGPDGCLLPARKAEGRRGAAQALVDHYGDKGEKAAAELALLFEAARQPARAIEYFLLAARNAV